MKCEFIKPDEKRCGSHAMRGSTFCFFHDPATREARKAASAKGGSVCPKPLTTLPPDTPDAPLVTGYDVRAFVAETLNHVRAGRLAHAVGNCLFVGAGVLLKAIESSELDRRLAALEEGHGPRRVA